VSDELRLALDQIRDVILFAMSGALIYGLVLAGALTGEPLSNLVAMLVGAVAGYLKAK
jgi:hypothetical protein